MTWRRQGRAHVHQGDVRLEAAPRDLQPVFSRRQSPDDHGPIAAGREVPHHLLHLADELYRAHDWKTRGIGNGQPEFAGARLCKLRGQAEQESEQQYVGIVAR